MHITLKDIEAAGERLRGVILHTPLIYSQTLSRRGGREVFLKLENLQTTGSFKLRGAVNRLTLLKARGEGDRVVAASAGNHGQGVAWAAAQVGLKATIVMPVGASITKQLACRGYGADLLLCGRNLTEALEKARELADQGYIFIHPFNDPEVVAGQGTLGLEILADLPAADTVILPVGGGGLAAGTALALKARAPRVRVIGVQTAQVPSLAAAREHGGPVEVPIRPTLGDGIQVAEIGSLTYPLLEKYLDDLVLVGENDIAQAILTLLESKKVLAEGAGAVAAAAFLGPLAGGRPGAAGGPGGERRQYRHTAFGAGAGAGLAGAGPGPEPQGGTARPAGFPGQPGPAAGGAGSQHSASVSRPPGPGPAPGHHPGGGHPRDPEPGPRGPGDPGPGGGGLPGDRQAVNALPGLPARALIPPNNTGNFPGCST